MASILALAGGAIINAFAFSGSSFLFSKFSDHGAAERERHNRAVENLQRDQIKYAEDRQKILDFISEELQRENHASKTFTNVDEAMEEYYLATRNVYLNYHQSTYYPITIIQVNNKKMEKSHSS